MTNRSLQHLLKLCVVTSAAVLALSTRADLREHADDDRQGREHAGDDRRGRERDDDDRRERQGLLRVATGQYITPRFLDGAVQQYLNPGLTGYPDFVAGEAVRSQLSPDGTTLAIITAGQNSLYKPDGTVDAANSTQYIFLYNVAGANKAAPVLAQVITQANAHVGLVFSPDGNTLYAAGGNDDAVYVYTRSGSGFTAAMPIPLGHQKKGVGLGVQPNASGMGISADGNTLVVANNYNDSISVIDVATHSIRYEHDLRPFFANNEGTEGGTGGTFPFSVVVKGDGTAYVSSDRDREVVVVDVSSTAAGRLIKRIKMDGNALGMTLDESQSKLYVAQDNADQVAVIDTSTNTVTTKIDARAPAGMLPSRKYTGAATFAVTLSRDGETLYAVNSGANSIAVIPLTGRKAHTVSGLIPTAYEPHDITFSADGSWMYIVNGKSVTGPAQPPTLRASSTRAATRRPPPRPGPRTSTSSSWSARPWSARRCRPRKICGT
jgi:YVTN family beta-propeller protein